MSTPTPSLKYRRVLLKLSGEALMGSKNFGIDADVIHGYAEEVAEIWKLGVEIAIVIGGGNFFRGVQGAAQGMDRTQSDNMGMLATVINGLAMQNTLEKINVPTRLQSAIEIQSVCETLIMRRAIRHLEKGRVVIFAAGTGNPYFTTDTAATLRGLEIKAEVLLKATRVDGIYTADPEKDATATRYTNLTFEQVISDKLNVMDMTAFTLSEENRLPIIVFNINEPSALRRIIEGEAVGTLVR
mgnify:CR=1 FL=1